MNLEICISSLGLFGEPIEDILSYTYELEVNNLEIIHEYPLEIDDLEVFDSYPIEISIHSPTIDLNIASTNESIRSSSITEIKKSMDLAYDLSSEIVIVHPGSISANHKKYIDIILDRNCDSLRECAEYANNLGIELCVENMPDIEGLLYKDINELNDLVNKLGINIALNVGHAHTLSYNIDDMLDLDNIKVVHVSDNSKNYDTHEALGKGNIKFNKLFSCLEKMDYKDLVTIEVNNWQDILCSLDYIKNL